MNALAKDVMNADVMSVKLDASLKKAVQIFYDHKINSLPVLDEDGNLVGILSESDIIRYCSQIHATSTRDSSGWTSPYEKIWEKTQYHLGATILHRVAVESLMTRRVISVRLDTTIIDVARIMRKKDINRVPVLDENNKLRGIIAREDIISYLATVE